MPVKTAVVSLHYAFERMHYEVTTWLFFTQELLAGHPVGAGSALTGKGHP